MAKFEKQKKTHIYHAKKRLDNDFLGSREAMFELAEEKSKQFQVACDVVFGNEEREILMALIGGSMLQAFSYGYGIGKVEGETLQKVIL